MSGSVADVAILMKALGLGIPAGIIVLTFMVVFVVTKFIGSKQDKDRQEHIDKWNSMIAMQKTAIDKQTESMQLVVSSNREEMDRIIVDHREETDRLYKLYERQSQSLEIICHNISTMSKLLETKHFCPNQVK